MTNGISGPIEYDPELFKHSGFESNPQGISRRMQPTKEVLPTDTGKTILGNLAVTAEEAIERPETDLGGEG